MHGSKKNSSGANRKRAFHFRQVNLILQNERSGNFSPIDAVNNCETSDIDGRDNEPTPERIRKWAIEHRIKKRALNSLLKLLISSGLKGLSPDSRTLLRTPRSIPISPMGSGQFWYNGIQKCLERMYVNLRENTDVKLNINVDGLPLFKSSKITFWPILGNVNGKYIKRVWIEKYYFAY